MLGYICSLNYHNQEGFQKCSEKEDGNEELYMENIGSPNTLKHSSQDNHTTKEVSQNLELK